MDCIRVSHLQELCTSIEAALTSIWRLFTPCEVEGTSSGELDQGIGVNDKTKGCILQDLRAYRDGM